MKEIEVDWTEEAANEIMKITLDKFREYYMNKVIWEMSAPEFIQWFIKEVEAKLDD